MGTLFEMAHKGAGFDSEAVWHRAEYERSREEDHGAGAIRGLIYALAIEATAFLLGVGIWMIR